MTAEVKTARADLADELLFELSRPAEEGAGRFVAVRRELLTRVVAALDGDDLAGAEDLDGDELAALRSKLEWAIAEGHAMQDQRDELAATVARLRANPFQEFQRVNRRARVSVEFAPVED
jgi:hypothetical protein